jgi:AraC-like DNA-binding protein
MLQFTVPGLGNHAFITQADWQESVHKNWSMKCDFDAGAEHKVLSSTWYMGDVRFEIADLSCQRWTWMPGHGLGDWRRETLVVYLIECGAVVVERHDTSIELFENSMLIFDGNIKYNQKASRDTRGVILRVPKNSLESRGAGTKLGGLFVPDPASSDVAVLKAFIAAAAGYGKQCSPHVGEMVAETLTDLLERCTESRKEPQRFKSSAASLRRIKRYLDRNVGNVDIDVDTVANAMGVSKRYLFKLFERDGSSVMRYLLQQRLATAKRILATNDVGLRITDIAERCGFSSVAHFSRAFKKQYGTSPTEHQRGGALDMNNASSEEG